MSFEKSVRSALVAILVSFFWSFGVLAESSSNRSIRIVGNAESTVTSGSVMLSDIAKISSRFVRDDEEMISLGKIELAQSPLPGNPLSLSAAQILERIRASGVDLDTIGYRFPRVVKVHRAARKITYQEIQMALEEAIRKHSDDAQLLSFDYNQDVLIVPGISTLGATIRRSARPGVYDFDLVATVEGQPPVRFSLQGQLEEWRNVPVAARSLSRGSRVNESDITMARLKSVHIPVDATTEPEIIIGQEASRNISAGEVFRNTKLAIPPVIAAGASILMRYKSDLLEATATGVALDNGIKGERIRVRNDASRRVLEATVLEPGLVGVNR